VYCYKRFVFEVNADFLLPFYSSKKPEKSITGYKKAQLLPALVIIQHITMIKTLAFNPN